MAPSLSVIEFQSSIERVKNLISNSFRKKISLIEYRTSDEGLCNVSLIVLPKNEVKNYFEAFVVLLNYQFHFYEEWDINETNSSNADAILNNWIMPEIKKFNFESLEKDTIHENIDWIVEAIIKACDDQSRKKKIESNPDRWGTYLNNMKLPHNVSFSDLGIVNIEFGTSLNLEWNEIDIMFKTPDNYVLFSWGTGA